LASSAFDLAQRAGTTGGSTSDFLARPPGTSLRCSSCSIFSGKARSDTDDGSSGGSLRLAVLAPFIDKRAERHPLRRPFAITALALALGGSAVLTALSKYQDATNPEFSAKLRGQEEEAKNFLSTPFFQQEIGRSVPVNPPEVKNPTVAGSRALKIYFANCANCHGSDATGGPLAPVW
jgi:mono/diheme cytochrome c family protein